MLRNVLVIRNTVSKAKSPISGLFQLGTTILTNFLILFQKMASTLPFPPLIKKGILSFWQVFPYQDVRAWACLLLVFYFWYVSKRQWWVEWWSRPFFFCCCRWADPEWSEQQWGLPPWNGQASTITIYINHDVINSSICTTSINHSINATTTGFSARTAATTSTTMTSSAPPSISNDELSTPSLIPLLV